MRLVSSLGDVSMLLSIGSRPGILLDPRRTRNRLPAGPHVTFVLDEAQPDDARAAPEPISDEVLPGQVRRPLFELWNLPAFLGKLRRKVGIQAEVQPQAAQKAVMQKSFGGLRIALYRLGRGVIQRSTSFEEAEQELCELLTTMQTFKTRFANLRMLGAPGPMLSCLIEWTPHFAAIPTGIRLAAPFELPIVKELEAIYSQSQAEIDLLIDELQMRDKTDPTMLDFVNQIVVMINLLIYFIEAKRQETLVGDVQHYQSMQHVLKNAEDWREVFELLAHAKDSLVIAFVYLEWLRMPEQNRSSFSLQWLRTHEQNRSSFSGFTD
jgi:hypothetical protein